MTLPAGGKTPVLASLVTVMPLFGVLGTVAVPVAVTGGPLGGVPVAVTTLVVLPAATSAAVSV